jgi:hypothetical protein
MAPGRSGTTSWRAQTEPDSGVTGPANATDSPPYPTGRGHGTAAALRTHRADLLWAVVVAVAYGISTLIVHSASSDVVGRAMTLAIHFTQGRLDLGTAFGQNDTLTIGGATYWVAGPMTFIPSLPFVPFPGLWAASRWIVPCGFGIAAAWSMLPLARRYGPGGSTTWWLSALGAFGTLLFTQAIRGNDYYLTHAEAMLFTIIALVEWQGRRRAWLIGLALGLAGLARPPVLLAAIPFGLAFILAGPGRRSRVVAFASPVALTIGLAGLYNWLRFGSPLETGYASSTLSIGALAQSRASGVFSISHIPRNLWLLVFNGFGYQPGFPFLVAGQDGHSILLTSPALLAAVGAGIRSRTAAILWASAGLVTVVLLLYYGGGGTRTFGYRYFLDATPFLLALTALAARRHFGPLEKLLIVMSVGFVSLGFVGFAF